MKPVFRGFDMIEMDEGLLAILLVLGGEMLHKRRMNSSQAFPRPLTQFVACKVWEKLVQATLLEITSDHRSPLGSFHILVIHNAGESSRTTHAAPTAVDACRYFAGLLLGALEGRSKEEMLRSFFPGPGPRVLEVSLSFARNCRDR
jgi:hypothetical protein